MAFTFSPPTGIQDTTQFPRYDTLFRQHLQTLLQQIPDYYDSLLGDIVHQPAIGTLANLTTTSKVIVGALNEHDAEIGVVSTLTTTIKTLVGAINEINANRYKKTDWTSGVGWRKSPDGIIEQWGKTSVSGSLALTFPIPFTDLSTVGFQESLYTNGPPGDITISHGLITLSSFSLYSNVGGSLTIEWKAIGK